MTAPQETSSAKTEKIEITPDITLDFPTHLLLERPILREHLHELFTDLLINNRLKPRSVPHILKEKGLNPLSNADYLVQSLIPPGDFRTGTVMEVTKTDIAQRVNNALENHQPLTVDAHLGTVKMNALLRSSAPNSPQLTELLYMRQIGDYVNYIADYPHGVNLNLRTDDLGDQFILEPLKISNLPQLQNEYGVRLKPLTQATTSSKTSNLNIAEFRTSNTETAEKYQKQLEENYKTLQSIWTKNMPLFKEFVDKAGPQYWREFFNDTMASSIEPMAEDTWRDMASKWFNPWLDKLKGNYGQLKPWLDEFVPPWLGFTTMHIEWILGLSSANDKAPLAYYHRQYSERATEIMLRLISREITHNQLYGEQSQATVNLFAGDTDIFHRSFLYKYGIPLSPSGFKKQRGYLPWTKDPYIYYHAKAISSDKPKLGNLCDAGKYQEKSRLTIDNLNFNLPVSSN